MNNQERKIPESVFKNLLNCHNLNSRSGKSIISSTILKAISQGSMTGFEIQTIRQLKASWAGYGKSPTRKS